VFAQLGFKTAFWIELMFEHFFETLNIKSAYLAAMVLFSLLYIEMICTMV